MKLIKKYYGKIDSTRLFFDENETALRLKTERGYTNETIEKCKKELLKNVDCRYCAIKVEIEVIKDTVDFGDFMVKSSSLSKNLFGSNECYIFAVTLGNSVDRLLKKLSVISLSEHYITDALASALAECAADLTEKEISSTTDCKIRFSPGYGDFDIEKQADVLKMLDAQKIIGVSLSKSFLMTPQKTITAIMGIK